MVSASLVGRFVRSLGSVIVVSVLAACGDDALPSDSGAADASIVDAGSPDAAVVDSGVPECPVDASPPVGLPTLSARGAVLTTSGTDTVPPPPLPVTATPPIVPWAPWASPSLRVITPNAQCARATRLVSMAIGSAETSTVREVRASFEGRPLELIDPTGTAVVEEAHASGWPASFYKPMFSLEGVTPRSGTLTVEAFDVDGLPAGTVSIPGFTVVAPPPAVSACHFATMPHPRILLSPDRLARARERDDGDPTSVRYWEGTVQPFLDALARAPDPTSAAFASIVPDPQSYVPALALCYQLTRGVDGSPAEDCARAAILLTDTIADEYLSGRRGFGADGGARIHSDLVALMLAFDWLHDELTGAQRDTYAELATAWVDWYRDAGPHASTPYSAAYAGYLHALALTIAATAGESSDASRLAAVLNRKLAHELPVLNQRLCGGDWPEGWENGALAVLELQLVNTLLHDAGADHSVLFDWVEAVPTWLTYAMTPDHRMTVPFGAAVGPTAHRTSPALLAVLSSTTADGPLASHLYRTTLATPGNDLRDPSPGFTTWELLFADGSESPDIGSLPLAYTATGTGRWISKSSMTDADAYQIVSEVMSYAGDGYGYANGDVRMYRGSQCLLCPAAYEGSDFRGTDRTRAFSTYLVNQLEQGPLARNAHVVSTQSSPELSAVTLRFASSYASGPYDEHVIDDSNPLHYIVREVVHVRPAMVVVHDMTFRRHPADTMTALWHLAGLGDRTLLNAHSFTIPAATGSLRVDAFTDYFVSPVVTAFETDRDATGDPVGTLMTERFLNDGSQRAPTDGTPQETDAFHVFTDRTDEGATRISGNLTPTGVRYVVEIEPEHCLIFERGGSIELSTVADLSECSTL